MCAHGPAHGLSCTGTPAYTLGTLRQRLHSEKNLQVKGKRGLVLLPTLLKLHRGRRGEGQARTSKGSCLSLDVTRLWTSPEQESQAEQGDLRVLEGGQEPWRPREQRSAEEREAATHENRHTMWNRHPAAVTVEEQRASGIYVTNQGHHQPWAAGGVSCVPGMLRVQALPGSCRHGGHST